MDTDHDLLVRIDEKLKTVLETYVTKKEFTPVKSIVYGMVGLILIGVVTALIAQVIHK